MSDYFINQSFQYHKNKLQVQSEAMKVPAFTLYTLHPTPRLCRLIALCLHRDFIGTSSEPHRNLAEGIPKEYRSNSEGSPKEKRSVIVPLRRRIPKDKHSINDRQTLRNQRRLATNNIDNKTTCQWHTKRRKATKNI